MSHPFQEGARGPCLVSLLWGRGPPAVAWGGATTVMNPSLVGRFLSKEGWGVRDESFKGGVSQGMRAGLHQSQPKGGGGGRLC